MKIGEGCAEPMKTRRRMRLLPIAIGLVTVFGWTSAHADIYTWVDASGKVNLSNRPPPEGARVTSVYREDPAVHAAAEAARAAAARNELNALTERVTQLERDLDAANDRPAPATIIYAPPAPPPAAYPPVIAQTIVVPSQPAYTAYTDCSVAWAGCFSPGNFGFYPGGFVVVGAPAAHRFDASRRGPHARTQPPPRATMPVGAIPDPVNLFPNAPGRR
jgi:hypothetical protein